MPADDVGWFDTGAYHRGMTVGMPGAKQGLRPEDPTLAELLSRRAT